MTFPDTSNLKLEIQNTPVGLVNLIENPSGELGGWGWITPTPSNNGLAGVLVSTVPHLRYTVAAAVSNSIRTENYPVTAGQYIAARWMASTSSTEYKASIDCLDASGAIVGTVTVPSSGFYAGSVFPASIGAFLIPATAVMARLRFDVYAPGGGSPAGGATIDVFEATMATAATSGALAALPFIAEPAYTDVLGPTHTIHVTRPALDVGHLEAEILDSTLDPSASTLIVPGKKCRLMALDSGTWKPIITARLGDDVSVTYHLKDPNIPASRRARIYINATDNTTRLANTSRPSGVGTITGLRTVLEGAGVPWNVNGSKDQLAAVPTVSSNSDATAIDQVAITRDSVRGYAWVDRSNVIQAWDSASLSTTLISTLAESAYSDLDIDWNLTDCINEVVVHFLRYNSTTGETQDIVHGPYIDQASRRQWGPHRKEFTIHGSAFTDSTGWETEANILAYANAVLAANATPVRRINSALIPIRSSADITVAKALIDLYDLAAVTNTAAGITGNNRVTSIEHTIESNGGGWLMRLGFAKVGSVAAPQVTPPVGAAVNVLAPFSSRRITANAAIANAAFTNIPFGSALENTSITFASGVWTVQRAGRYLINSTVQFAGNATGRRVVRLLIAGAEESRVEANPDDANDWSLPITYLRRLAVGDTVEVQAYQNSGGSLNALGGQQFTNAQVTWIGE